MGATVVKKSSNHRSNATPSANQVTTPIFQYRYARSIDAIFRRGAVQSFTGRFPRDFQGSCLTFFPVGLRFRQYDNRPRGGARLEIPIFRRRPISREPLNR